jgi:very-short-patch-repair endonuclease
MPFNLTKTAKSLRKNATRVETILWSQLRAKQFKGLKFRRQQPIDEFIVDFVCFEKKLIIELDGGQHARAREEDRKRDNSFTEKGYTVLRFWNNEVLENLAGVLEVIRRKCL